MAEGFLGRWSRRKQEVREAEQADGLAKLDTPAAGVPSAQPSPGGAGGGRPPAVVGDAPVPTLEDVAALTPQSDFARFVARDVPPVVRTAALKKLFADPHFNTMDGLDIYIGDYTKAEALPASMLRGLAAARSAGLFRDEERAACAADSTPESMQGVAKSNAPSPPPAADDDPDDHPDLRLQQDDAAEGGEPGHGAG